MTELLKNTTLPFFCWLFLSSCISFAQNPILTNPSSCALHLPLTDYSCPDNNLFFNPDVFAIEVLNAPGTILGQDVYLKEVRLLIQHEWVGDLDIVLFAPSGLSAELTSDNGGGEDNYGNPSLPSCSGYTSFSVVSCISITEAEAPFTAASYLPETSLLTFNDDTTNPNGTWLLQICDDVIDDSGFLEYVELVFETIDCLPITELEAIAQDTTTAVLDWNTNGFCGTAVIEYGPPGFIPGADSLAGEGQVLYANCPPFALENLDPESSYEIYIRKYCDGGFSENGCPILIETGCQPPPISLLSDFENELSCAPLFCGQACTMTGTWFNNFRDDGFDWLINSGSTPTLGTGPSDDAGGGGNYAYIETSGTACLNGNFAYLMSNCIQLDKQGTDTCHLSFAYHMYGDNIFRLELEVSEDGGFNWENLWQISGNQGDQWQKAYISLSDFEEGEILQFRFIATGGNGSEGDIALDEITFFGSVDLGRPANQYFADNDNDGYGDVFNFVESCATSPPPGYVTDNTDCNDNDPTINPGMEEIPCDNIDNNCSAGILEDDAVLPPIPVENDTVCSGTPAVLCANPGFGGFVFWYDSPSSTVPVAVGDCFIPDLPLNNSPIPVEHTFYVEENNFICLSGERTEAKVVVNPRPIVLTIDQPAICPGETFDLSSINILDANLTGSSFTFHSASPANSSNQLPSTIVSPSSSSLYYFLATSPEGCTDEGSVLLQINPEPALSFAPAQAFNLCVESVQILEAFPGGGTAPYAFQWSTGSTSTTTEVSAAFQAGTIDTYGLTVTDANGCTKSEEVLVTTSASIDSIRREVQNVSTCNGMDGAISLTPLNGVSPFQFIWEGSNGISGSASGIPDTMNIENLPQGLYDVTITDASSEPCAFIIRSVLVNGPSAVVNSIDIEDVSCNGENDGAICLEIMGSSPSIIWNTGATSSCIDNLPGGFYSVTITDEACENILNNLEIQEPDSITFSTKLDNPSCYDSSDGLIDLTVYGGIAPYSFEWNTGAMTEDLTNQPAGTYTVTVTDAADCIRIQSYTLTAPEILAINIDSLRPVTCAGQSDGYIQLGPTGGTSPYQINWNTESTAPVIGNLASDTYTVTLTDFNGCQLVQSIDITEPDPLELSLVERQNPECFGDLTGAITVGATGGNMPYIYTWNTGDTGAMISGLGVGFYSVTVSDQNACPIDSLEIELESLSVLDLDIFITEPSCEGALDGSITIQPNGISPFSYSWGSSTLSSIGSGSYPVTIEDGQGCFYDTTILVQAPQLISVEFAPTAPVCHDDVDGKILTNLISSGAPPLEFEWSNGSSDIDLIGIPPGAYQLSITDNNGCQFISDTILLENPPPLSIEILSLGHIDCNGEQTGFIETSTSGGIPPYSYQWVEVLSDQASIFNLDAGTYSLVVIDSNSCPIDTTLTLQEAPPLEVNVVIEQGTICEEAGNKLRAEISGGTTPYQLLWSNGQTDSCLFNVPSGDYELSVTDANGCIEVISSIKVREEFLPLELDSFIVRDISCNGASDGSMTAVISGGAPPYRFHFSNNHIVNTSDTSVTCSNLPLDFDYQVTISSLTNGCSVVSETQEIQEPPILNLRVDSSSFVNCFGGFDGAIYTTAEGGTPPYSYEWYREDAPEQLISIEADPIHLSSGNYMGILIDDNGCTDTLESINLGNANTILEILEDLTFIEDVECKGDSTGSIDITVSGGAPPYTYEWSNGSIGEDLVHVPAGSYQLTLTDSDTCRLIFPLFEVDEPLSGISVEAELEHLRCKDIADGQIELAVEGGTLPYSFFWEYQGTFLDQDSSTISGLQDGFYTVAIQDSNACTRVQTFELTAPPFFDVVIELDPPMPPSSGMAKAMAEGGVPDYHYQWNSGEESQNIEITDGGVFSVTVTDENNCTAVDSAFLVNNQELPLFESIIVSPNPSNGHFGIDIQLRQVSDLRLELYNTLGECLQIHELPASFQNHFDIDLRDYSSGVYLLLFRQEDGRMHLEKVQLVQ